MRTPEQQQARLERLLARRPEFRTVGAGDDPRSAIIRRDALLVPATHAARVEESVREWTDRRDDLEHLGMARFTLRRDADVPDLITGSLTPAGGDALASPIHLFRGEPDYGGGPVGPPSPLADTPPVPGQATGRPVHVAILDTGLAAHPWFPANTWTALGGDVDDRLDADHDYELDAQAGHGTFIGGVVRQHAPGARLLIGRVLSSIGVCDEVELLEALHLLGTQSRGHRIDVLNLSLGAYTWDDRPPAGVAETLKRLGPDAVVVAAAGNNGTDRKFWPAALDDVVAVGALAEDGLGRAEFSNHGPWVDAWAVGEHVPSSFVVFDGPMPPTANIDPDCFKGFATWSGTSFAAPRVAAALAHRAAERDASPRTVLPGVLEDFSLPASSGLDAVDSR